MASLGGIVCFLLTLEIQSTRQYMLAGLYKVRDRGTQRSEHTAICPVVPFPMPTPTSHDTWHNPSFEDFCSAKEA